jgi:very-short-patch-repair endonuclease
MPHPSELPEDLRHRAFTFAEAIAAGVTPQRLRASDLDAPFHGIRIAEPTAAGDPPSLRRQCETIAPRLRPFQFFSHETALALIGAPLPQWPHLPGIHVSAHRPAREPRTRGVIGHRLQTRESAAIFIGGLPVEHPARAWRQVGRQWIVDDLVAAADFLIARRRRPLATIEDLRDEVRVMGDVAGRRLTQALRDAREGSESPEETRLRLVITRNGLPEPELNWDLRDAGGRLIARLDLAYPSLRVGVEYDGRVHADDHRQFEADADRWSAIARAGWTHVRVLRHHMRGRPPRAVDMVREALRSAGWSGWQ